MSLRDLLRRRPAASFPIGRSIVPGPRCPHCQGRDLALIWAAMGDQYADLFDSWLCPVCDRTFTWPMPELMIR